MDDHGRTIQHALAQWRQAFGIDGRRHQEHTAGMQMRGGGDRHVGAEAGSDQDQFAFQVLAEIHQAGEPALRRIDAAIVHGLRLVALRAGGIGEHGDLATPGAAFLSMRKHYIPTGHGSISYTA